MKGHYVVLFHLCADNHASIQVRVGENLVVIV